MSTNEAQGKAQRLQQQKMQDQKPEAVESHKKDQRKKDKLNGIYYSNDMAVGCFDDRATKLS